MALTKTPIELSSTPSIVDGGNATAITIDSSERVGIGGSPSHKLDIVDSAAGFGARITNNQDSSQGLQVRTSDNDTGLYILDLQTSTSATGTNYSSQFVVEKGGNVGIGETTPLGKLHVKEGDSGQGSVNSNFDQLVLEDDAHSGMTILSGTSSDGGIYFGDSGGNNLGQFKYQHSNNNFAFITNDGTTDLRIDSDGIKFNGDSAAANGLDDYEEGTWSPQIKAYGGNNAGQSVVSALYTKIGNTVNCVAYINNIDLSAITSGTYIIMDNFPFVATSYGDFSIAYRDGTHATTAIVGGYVQNSTDHAYFVGTNGVEQQQTGSAAITKMMINVTYKTTA